MLARASDYEGEILIVWLESGVGPFGKIGRRPKKPAVIEESDGECFAPVVAVSGTFAFVQSVKLRGRNLKHHTTGSLARDVTECGLSGLVPARFAEFDHCVVSLRTPYWDGPWAALSKARCEHVRAIGKVVERHKVPPFLRPHYLRLCLM